ncbi:uncharacterized protein PHALS_00844 [Plasmopara halstedii]|uniref:Uncharacterized protein n=1 Tax=Plasmopara halstedii TaxID=4781 RepID=A0A0P1AS30_PLAHL|nr:uncharacterized protein PHALS_00844 [Plasmopara halstedii]CEG44481.1 hypothetical protein PHALS_00844 [Plasmopara halstedii]|eukprot:XP_024580850.1 hypothetical protein PHALS_00844 [Plasmopara halstedii]
MEVDDLSLIGQSTTLFRLSSLYMTSISENLCLKTVLQLNRSAEGGPGTLLCIQQSSSNSSKALY